jgi:hypothetical protein
MLHSKALIFLWLGCTALGAVPSARSEDLDARKEREMKIPGTGGEPSFLLRISAEGTRGVVSVREERGKELQSLTCLLLRDHVESTEEELAAARQQFVTQFVVDDFDFDRHLDLAGIREFGAKWARYCVWLYDPKQHIFVKDFLAEQMELLVNLKPLGGSQISSSHMGPANIWRAVYQVAGLEGSRPERQLVPVYSCLVETTPDGEKPTAVVMTRYEGVQPVVARLETANMDMRAALNRCSRKPVVQN